MWTFASSLHSLYDKTQLLTYFADPHAAGISVPWHMRYLKQSCTSWSTGMDSASCPADQRLRWSHSVRMKRSRDVGLQHVKEGIPCLIICFSFLLLLTERSGLLYFTSVVSSSPSLWVWRWESLQVCLNLYSSSRYSQCAVFFISFISLFEGLLIRFKFWRPPQYKNCFDDQAFWEVCSHLL